MRRPADKRDADQIQPEVTSFGEQAVERRLVDDHAGDCRAAIVVVGDGEAIEPPRPAQVEMPPDANLVVLLHPVPRYHAVSICAAAAVPMSIGDAATLAEQPGDLRQTKGVAGG